MTLGYDSNMSTTLEQLAAVSLLLKADVHAVGAVKAVSFDVCFVDDVVANIRTVVVATVVVDGNVEIDGTDSDVTEVVAICFNKTFEVE